MTNHVIIFQVIMHYQYLRHCLPTSSIWPPYDAYHTRRPRGRPGRGR